jgi:hypothetical protein
MENRKTDGNTMISVDHLDLSIRAYNAVRNMGIKTAAELARYSRAELLSLDQFGRHSIESVRQALASVGMKMAGDKDPERLLKEAVVSLKGQSQLLLAAAGTARNFSTEIREIALATERATRAIEACVNIKKYGTVKHIKKPSASAKQLGSS